MRLIWVGELKAISEMSELSTWTSTFTARDRQSARDSSLMDRFKTGLLEARYSSWIFLRLEDRLERVFVSNKVLKVPLAESAAILLEVASSSQNS